MNSLNSLNLNFKISDFRKQVECQLDIAKVLTGNLSLVAPIRPDLRVKLLRKDNRKIFWLSKERKDLNENEKLHTEFSDSETLRELYDFRTFAKFEELKLNKSSV